MARDRRFWRAGKVAEVTSGREIGWELSSSKIDPTAELCKRPARLEGKVPEHAADLAYSSRLAPFRGRASFPQDYSTRIERHKTVFSLCKATSRITHIISVKEAHGQLG